MQIFQDGEWIKAARITGPTHHFLGLRFGVPPTNTADKLTEVVVSGVVEANRELGTHYQVAEIMTDPEDQFSARAYLELAYQITRHAAQSGLKQAA